MNPVVAVSFDTAAAIWYASPSRSCCLERICHRRLNTPIFTKWCPCISHILQPLTTSWVARSQQIVQRSLAEMTITPALTKFGLECTCEISTSSGHLSCRMPVETLLCSLKFRPLHTVILYCCIAFMICRDARHLHSTERNPRIAAEQPMRCCCATDATIQTWYSTGLDLCQACIVGSPVCCTVLCKWSTGIYEALYAWACIRNNRPLLGWFGFVKKQGTIYKAWQTTSSLSMPTFVIWNGHARVLSLERETFSSSSF